MYINPTSNRVLLEFIKLETTSPLVLLNEVTATKQPTFRVLAVGSATTCCKANDIVYIDPTNGVGIFEERPEGKVECVLIFDSQVMAVLTESRDAKTLN